MTSFIETVSHAICEYKKILKRKLPQQSYTQKLKQLGIKRAQLRNLNEPDLFDVANKILKELEESYGNQAYSRLYSGVHEFISYLKNILNTHRIEDKKVVNTAQKVSAALIEAAQIISLPHAHFTDDTFSKLESCIDGIIRYGNHSHAVLMLEAIKNKGLEKLEGFETMQQRLEAITPEVK